LCGTGSLRTAVSISETGQQITQSIILQIKFFFSFLFFFKIKTTTTAVAETKDKLGRAVREVSLCAKGRRFGPSVGSEATFCSDKFAVDCES
jgi:hypothetical protein